MDHLGGNMKNNKIQKATEIVIPIAIPTALVLVIAIVFRNYSNRFKLSLEELLGIVAITTFLIGFSSVRLQSNLEYWKESASRLINRVLEQNANDDLLPLPTNFNQYETNKEKFEPHDRAAQMTSVLTWSNFGISSYLIYMHWRYCGQIAALVLIQIIHLLIVLASSFEPYFAERTSKKYTKRQPFERYDKLSSALIDYLTTDEKNIEEIENTKNNVINAVDGLDDSLPSWCWLYLIRCHIDPELTKTLYGPQLQRLRELAKQSKHIDDFSHIAFVWSTYLLEDDKASLLIRYMDIQRIMKFSNETVIQASGGRTTALQRQMWSGGDIYAEMALRCVYKAWNPPKAEPNAPTNKSESAETDQSPLTVLGNHLKMTRDNRLKYFKP